MKKKIILPQFDELMPELIGVWRRFLKISGPQDRLQTREFRSVVEQIQKMREAASFKTRESLAAYMLYYFPLHYAEGLSLLGELPNTPKRVLDLFCGPAPFSLAALEHGAEEVVGLDENPDALRVAGEIIGRRGYAFVQRQWTYPKPLPEMGKFDLIISAYAPHFVDSLFDLLTDEGILLIVDSSWPKSNKQLLEQRNKFIEKGLHIVAPCIYKGNCPALIHDFPCYAQRELKKPYLVSEIQRSADINLSSLKMSYLMVSKKPQIDSTAPLYRVVSPALNTRFGKRYALCGHDGYRSLGSRIEEYPKESRAFEYLQRGDLIAIEKAHLDKETYEVVEDTLLQVVASTGKPVPFEHLVKQQNQD